MNLAYRDALLITIRGKWMNNFVRCIFVVFALAIAPVAKAQSYNFDQTGLWGDEHSGWGMQLVQQADTIFATMFHYGADNKPVWFIATLTPTSAENWAGTVYKTTGPYFGGAWDASKLSLTDVGSMTWYAQSLNSGELKYTINGQAVQRWIQRSTFAYTNVAGLYGGAMNLKATGTCASGVAGPHYAELAVTTSADFSTGSLTVHPTGGRTCTMPSATVVLQSGQLFNIIGNFTCTDGENGTMSLVGAKTTKDGALMGTLSLSGQNCYLQGEFGGVRE